jgi:hypothetical protein
VEVVALGQVRIAVAAISRHFHQHRLGETRSSVYLGGFRNRTREVRDEPHIMGLTKRLDLHILGDAAHVGNGHAGVVDELLFDEFIHVPLATELLPHRDGNLRVLAQFAVDPNIF